MPEHLPPVSITGTGCLSPAGKSPSEIWESAFRLRLLSPSSGSASPAPHGRAREMALHSARAAMASAGWSPEPGDAFILATTTGLTSLWEGDLMDFERGVISLDTLFRSLCHEPLGLFADSLAAELGFSGPVHLLASACSASTQAIGLARDLIVMGRARRVLVGGVETSCALTREGFKSFQLLSSRVAKPFDEARDGINLAEASAFLCLEAGALDRALACVEGAGCASDSFHMTAPEPQGKGCAAAMKAALADARVGPENISWIHAHGTGSISNDLAEARAIRSVFGLGSPPVTSTKAVHGHALAASGALETILCIEAMRRNCVLATAGLSRPDPTLEMTLPVKHEERPVGRILKNTLGFGGINASLVLCHPSEVTL